MEIDMSACTCMQTEILKLTRRDMKYDGMPRPKAKAKEPSLDTGHDVNRLNRVEKTYSELKQQGFTFKSTVEYTRKCMSAFLSDMRNRPVYRVVLIGCGDSWFVGTCVELLVERLLGCSCQSYDAFEFARARFNTVDEGTIVVGQSASGTTAVVLDALEKSKSRGAYTIGISNTENAAILDRTDFGLLVQARREGWPTQATTSAIGAIAFLFASLAREKGISTDFALSVLDEIEAMPEKISKAIEMAEEPIVEAMPMLLESVFFQSTGTGSLFGAAQVAGAKLKELCPVHAASFPLEEFHHYRTLKPKDPLILFLQGGSAGQREIDTAQVGAYDGGFIIVIGPSVPEEISAVADLAILVPSTLPELQAIVSMVASHLIAYHLAKQKFMHGIGYPSEDECNG